jgi:hypothetical protein
MRRVLIYAAIYGCVGALIGTCVALYTRDIDAVPKGIVLQNGSAIKAGKSHSSSTTPAVSEVAESTTSPVAQQVEEE